MLRQRKASRGTTLHKSCVEGFVHEGPMEAAGRAPDLSADSCKYCRAMRRSAEICKPDARACRGKHARGDARREHASRSIGQLFQRPACEEDSS